MPITIEHRSVVMAARLQGKVALVTGTGSGIGKAIAERFVTEGAKVVAVDISGNQNAVAEALGPNCLPFQADVSKSADVQAMLAAAMSKFGALHVLCNNAAIEGHMAPVGEYPEGEWEKVMAINLRSVFLGMRYGIPLMLKSGDGSIVNTASMAAMVAFPNMAAYCAAKGGVKQLTKTAAVEYADKGIRANAICPGTIKTAITAALPPEYIKAIINANPVKRIAEPVEVAHLALFLASDESCFITGTEITIDGGYTAL
jgi:NAD(P)-dependent dehydrogenase (short-subunit alcohol dehydrogenase family)